MYIIYILLSLYIVIYHIYIFISVRQTYECTCPSISIKRMVHTSGICKPDAVGPNVGVDVTPNDTFVVVWVVT